MAGRAELTELPGESPKVAVAKALAASFGLGWVYAGSTVSRQVVSAEGGWGCSGSVVVGWDWLRGRILVVSAYSQV